MKHGARTSAATTPAEPRPRPPRPSWDRQVLRSQPYAHFAQSEAWAEVRGGSPWRAARALLPREDGRVLAVQTFSRRVPALGRVHHALRLSGVDAAAVPALTQLAASRSPRGGLAFKAELYQPHDEDLVSAFLDAGWRLARGSQYRHAVAVDLRPDEERIFAAFKSRARNEVRAAERQGVVAEEVPLTDENVATMLALTEATRMRSGAFFRGEEHLRRTWRLLTAAGRGRLYFARHDGEVMAGAFILTFGRSAWYKDGGSLRANPRLMAPRALHWAIMRDLRAAGIERYELGAVSAPADAENGPLAGLHRFKTAFAHEVETYMPALEYPLGPAYRAWRSQEPNVLRAHALVRGDYWY